MKVLVLVFGFLMIPALRLQPRRRFQQEELFSNDTYWSWRGYHMQKLPASTVLVSSPFHLPMRKDDGRCILLT